jgi:hypoxanthine phosphoribosyltransferase
MNDQVKRPEGDFLGINLKRELLISKESIQDRVKELAQQISADYQGKELVLIGILNGVVFFLADLAREITVPTKIDFIRASSYGSQMTSSGSIRLSKDVEIPLKGKPVILVEDIVDTGLTLAHIIELLRQKQAQSIKVCALIDKLERRERDIPIDYCGFQIKEGFIVGYGIDFNEEYRHLPDISVLREDPEDFSGESQP